MRHPDPADFKMDESIDKEIISDILVQVGESAIPYLSRALSSKNENLQRGALMVLSKMDSSAITSSLIEFLEDHPGTSPLTEIAVETLIKIGHSTSIEPLVQSLVAEDGHLNFHIVQVLRQIGDPAAIPYLIQHLNNKNTDKIWLVIDTLFKIGNPPSDALIEGLQDERKSVRKLIIENSLGQDYTGQQVREPLLPVIAHGLEDPDGQLAGRSIAWFIEDEAIEDLKEIHDEHIDAAKDAILDELVVRRNNSPPIHFNAQVVGRVLKSFVDRRPKLHGEILEELQDAAFSHDPDVRERAAKVAREFDVKEFAARVRKDAEEHPEAAKQIMRILGGAEATAFFTEMQTEMQEKAIKNYRQSLSRVEDIGLKRWEDLTLQTRRGFYVNMGMSLALFLVGTGVIIWGLWTLTRSDDLVQQIGGAFLSAVAAFATTYSGRFWKDPVEHVKDFSAQQIRQQSAFIGYMHALGELRLAFERDYARDEMSPEAIERHQRLLSEASDRMSKQLSIEG